VVLQRQTKYSEENEDVGLLDLWNNSLSRIGLVATFEYTRSDFEIGKSGSIICVCGCEPSEGVFEYQS
jgi:hypothetical protein